MNLRHAVLLAAVLAGAPLLSEAHAQESEIPGFVSQVFEWYADGLISDTEVLNAIEYLVGQGIIELPSSEAPADGYGSLADSGVLESLSYDNEFVLSYQPTAEYDGIREWMQDQELLESEVQYYNDEYRLPYDVDVVVEECGNPGAYWSPYEYKIGMCYEFVKSLIDLHGRFADQGDPELEDFVGDVVVGVFNHEMGHALVTMYKLPITGMEEDAVDQFAALNSLSFADEYDDPTPGQEMLRSLARFWEYHDMDTGEDGRTNYSGVHSLSVQRHYNMACLLYGSDPVYNQDLAIFEELPHDRAVGCETEYNKIKSSWSRLIEPYAEPAWADLP